MCKDSSDLYGAIQARAAVDDGPIFNPTNINNASFEAQLYFAKAMNKFEAKQANVNVSQLANDDSIKGTVINRINMSRTPEALLPKQVFGKVDKKMTQWDAYYKRAHLPKIQKIENKYNKIAQTIKDPERFKALEIKKQRELDPIRKEAAQSYRNMVGKQFKQANGQIQEVFNQFAENPKKLDAELKKMGLTRRDAYYSHQYLNWLENGGPFFEFNKGSGNKAGGEATQDLISTITGKKVSFDPKQVLYNTTEFVQKAPAIAGFKNTVGGILDAQKAAHNAKLTIYDKLPELEKMGIYANDYSPLRPASELDTTTKTQNMLDNLSYYTGKRMGNVQKAMTGIAYRPKPWNDTFGFQDPRFKSAFTFMSFQFRHMQQYGGWWKQAAKGNKEAIKSLTTYSLMTGLLFGDRAAVPAPLYWLAKAFHPELDNDIKELQKDIPILNTGIIGEAGKLATGGSIEFDMTKYTQPFGGVAIGIGSDIAQTTWESATRVLPKTVKEIQDGRVDKAVAVAVDGVTQSSQMFRQGANALIQKTVAGVTKAYLEDEFDLEGIAKYTGQKYFGKEAITAAN